MRYKDKNEFLNDLVGFIGGLDGIRESFKVVSRTKIFGDGLIDSIKIIDLIAFIEKKLSIQIDENKISMENFETPQKIADSFYEK